MSTPATANSGPRTWKHAAVVPVVILLVMVGFIGLMATLFLFNTRYGAVTLAGVAAAGILFSVSLLASSDRLNGGQKLVAVGAGVVPLLLGGLIATGVIGGIADEDRQWNVQPLQITPEDAPVIAAENQQEFCLPDPEGGDACEPTEAWEFSPTAEEDNVAFVFDNREAGVVHNVEILTEEGGEEILASTLITGPNEEYFVSEVPLEELPETFYFFCTVHAEMNGEGTVVAEDAA